MRTALLLFGLLMFFYGANAQSSGTSDHLLFGTQPLLPAKQNQLLMQRVQPLNRTGKSGAKMTSYAHVFDTSQWNHRVDSTWGPGYADTSKLTILNTFWTIVDSAYPCFVHLPNYNWDSIINAMRTEISGGVSRGRFAGIINQLRGLINDGHTNYYDDTVDYPYSLYRGLPLVRGESGLIGACLTTLHDTEAMVYDALPGQPFGLQPGDLILGYNGVPWATLVRTMIEYRLPTTIYNGSTDSATFHRYIQAAGENWYLFDTINIQKCDGSVINLPTSLMDGVYNYEFCTEQMPQPGIKKVSIYGYYYDDSDISWGVLKDTHIGYIYLYDCIDISGMKMYNAVKTLVEDSLVTGLIIDIRTNFGGGFNAYTPAFTYLNDGDVSWVGYGQRSDPHDHMAMYIDGPTYWYDIIDTSGSFFNHPIALLTGPNAVSAGDFMPVLFRHDPWVKTFGESTAGAYGSLTELPAPYADYPSTMQEVNFFLASDPTNYISHTQLPVDFPMWFNRDSVCHGVDNIVTSAVDWINSTDAVKNVPAQTFSANVYPNPATDHINIAVTTATGQNITVQLCNMLGNVVLEEHEQLTTGYNALHINIAGRHIAAGNYSIMLLGANGNRLVKQLSVVK